MNGMAFKFVTRLADGLDRRALQVLVYKMGL
jgi:hypothetical protein